MPKPYQWYWVALCRLYGVAEVTLAEVTLDLILSQAYLGERYDLHAKYSLPITVPIRSPLFVFTHWLRLVEGGLVRMVCMHVGVVYVETGGGRLGKNGVHACRCRIC